MLLVLIGVVSCSSVNASAYANVYDCKPINGAEIFDEPSSIDVSSMASMVVMIDEDKRIAVTVVDNDQKPIPTIYGFSKVDRDNGSYTFTAHYPNLTVGLMIGGLRKEEPYKATQFVIDNRFNGNAVVNYECQKIR